MLYSVLIFFLLIDIGRFVYRWKKGSLAKINIIFLVFQILAVMALLVIGENNSTIIYYNTYFVVFYLIAKSFDV
jgi:hypothetical protein